MLKPIEKTFRNKVKIVCTCWVSLIALWGFAILASCSDADPPLRKLVATLAGLADWRLCLLQIVSVFLVLGLATAFRRRTTGEDFERTLRMFYEEVCSFTMSFSVIFILAFLIDAGKRIIGGVIFELNSFDLLGTVAGFTVNFALAYSAWNNAQPNTQ